MTLYRPSNGTEGLVFQDHFCVRCIYDGDEGRVAKYCDILSRTMIYEIEDPEYPREWIYDKDGQPICTAFEESPHD